MKRGLTLVEVIVSLALLVSVSVFLLNLFPTAMTTLRSVQRAEEFDARARSLLELYACENWPVGKVQAVQARWRELPVSGEVQVLAYADSDPKLLVLLRLQLQWEKGELVRETLVQRLNR
ncbi:MAG: type II secretion system protein [Candidatus Eremiobacteraeota bacterium]|nr:type II secretion system protein [Candidatus Eremiobacteraeota bacterium]MCW5871504.1 type II secretion system protein [Candidatus Eremiobacteraeota bacterium]